MDLEEEDPAIVLDDMNEDDAENEHELGIEAEVADPNIASPIKRTGSAIFSVAAYPTPSSAPRNQVDTRRSSVILDNMNDNDGDDEIEIEQGLESQQVINASPASSCQIAGVALPTPTTYSIQSSAPRNQLFIRRPSMISKDLHEGERDGDGADGQNVDSVVQLPHPQMKVTQANTTNIFRAVPVDLTSPVRRTGSTGLDAAAYPTPSSAPRNQLAIRRSSVATLPRDDDRSHPSSPTPPSRSLSFVAAGIPSQPDCSEHHDANHSEETVGTGTETTAGSSTGATLYYECILGKVDEMARRTQALRKLVRQGVSFCNV
ncbi:hypothetical protein SERLADRAFT_473105 [Serpula lacrymans var. lacrymans S7.9]|nr:uncharacterized protein SERLADRAFT_473105 [Serpula lacrymans var. lacrymans S7.9]EGO22366.1 hypothetical protein SERLADRAFT_473105 [Serpula lacrymans var. lacrymans S7.9]